MSQRTEGANCRITGPDGINMGKSLWGTENPASGLTRFFHQIDKMVQIPELTGFPFVRAVPAALFMYCWPS
jgi:hypothetical protein